VKKGVCLNSPNLHQRSTPLYIYDTIRYDTLEEINVVSKAECVQLNVAHVDRKNKKSRN